MARPDKYKTHVEPYLDKIQEMCLIMTEAQIAETLGVSLSAWKRYKSHYEPLRASLKKGRKDLVMELKSTLIKKAKGFNYEETKTTKERVPGEDKLTVTKEEVFKKYAAPDVAALNLLLKNYDKDNWANDPQMMEIRKKELELAERKLEDSEW